MHTSSAHPASATHAARLAAALTVIVLVVTGTVAGASAHGVEGEMTLTKLEQTGPTTVHVEVGIVYDGDQDPAEDASVEATLIGADGNAVGPTDLPRVDTQSSLYAADIEVTGPGTWSVEVSSTEPNGAASGAIEVVAQGGAAPGTETTAVPEPGETSTSVTEEDPADQIMTANGTAEGAEPVTNAVETSSGENAVLLIVLGVVVVVALAAGGLLVLRRRGAGSAHDRTDDGPPPPDQIPSTTSGPDGPVAP